MNNVLVLDNGAYDIKVGFSNGEMQRVSNAITRSKDRRVFVGSQIESCKDFAGLVYRRPIEKGHLYNWESEKAIWDSVFFANNSQLQVNPSETTLIATETPFTYPNFSSNMDQIIFEEYQFDALYRCCAGSLVPWNPVVEELFAGSYSKPVAECVLVVDCGYSYTHILPVVLGEVYGAAVKRLDVAGKMLTNYLKETISFRYYNMMNETFLVNKIKESTCFVSQDFSKDLQLWRDSKTGKSPFKLDYMLPDHKKSHHGYVVTSDTEVDKDSQVLSLDNERFTVPEALFNPSSTLGLKQAGLAEGIIQAVNKVPQEVQSLLLSNIVLVGGTSRLIGLKERLVKDVEPLAPQGTLIRASVPSDPVSFAWQGGAALGNQPEMLAKVAVSRSEYLEYGERRCMERFGIKREPS